MVNEIFLNVMAVCMIIMFLYEWKTMYMVAKCSTFFSLLLFMQLIVISFPIAYLTGIESIMENNSLWINIVSFFVHIYTTLFLCKKERAKGQLEKDKIHHFLLTLYKELSINEYNPTFSKYRILGSYTAIIVGRFDLEVLNELKKNASVEQLEYYNSITFSSPKQLILNHEHLYYVKGISFYDIFGNYGLIKNKLDDLNVLVKGIK